jgi:hypothetical protein
VQKNSALCFIPSPNLLTLRQAPAGSTTVVPLASSRNTCTRQMRIFASVAESCGILSYSLGQTVYRHHVKLPLIVVLLTA